MSIQSEENTIFKLSSSYDPNGSITISKLEVCRICLKKGTIPLFKPKPKIGLIKLMIVITKLAIHEYDDFPKYLCYDCYELLKAVIAFVKNAHKSHDILLNNIICIEDDDKTVELESPYEEESLNNDVIKEKVIIKERLESDIDDINENSFLPTIPHVLEKSDEKILDSVSEESSKLEHEDMVDNEFINSNIQLNSKEVKRLKRNEPMKCHICHKIYQGSYLKYHIMRHENPKQFVCDVCGKCFPLKQALERHQTIHESTFPYQCKMCPYRGRLAEALKKHMLSHANSKKFLCHICGKKFNYISNRNRHVKNHEKSKYHCFKCDLTYNRETFLIRHNLKVHNEKMKSYTCEICDKNYASTEQLQKHKYKAHQIYSRGVCVKVPMYKNGFKVEEEL